MPLAAENESSLRKIAARAGANFAGYVSDCRWFLIVFSIAAMLDLLTTMRFMLVDGTENELHPAIRFVSRWMGPIAGPLLGKLCQFIAAIGITFYPRRYAKGILVLASFLYLWAAWYNVWGKHLYVPRLMDLIALK